MDSREWPVSKGSDVCRRHYCLAQRCQLSCFDVAVTALSKKSKCLKLRLNKLLSEASSDLASPVLNGEPCSGTPGMKTSVAPSPWGRHLNLWTQGSVDERTSFCCPCPSSDNTFFMAVGVGGGLLSGAAQIPNTLQ